MAHIPRLFIDAPLASSSIVAMSDMKRHHLKHVLRKQQEDNVLVFNGNDGEWEATIHRLTGKEGTLEVRTQLRPQETVPDVWLLFAPIKASIQYLIEKSTELGINVLAPVDTEHTVLRHSNREKWQVYAVEAAEQCERLTVPHVAEMATLTHTLLNWDENRSLLWCDESGSGVPIAQALAGQQSKQLAVLIGPEGGFSKQEHALLSRTKNVIPVSLGPRILRADTAALAAITCVQALWGDWQLSTEKKEV